MKIAVCDDERGVADALKRQILSCLQEMEIVCDIDTFLSGKDVLREAEEMDIIFLDIEMPEMDGIETGKRIKGKNPNCTIIMATGNIGRFKEAFRINAFRYITKPFDTEEIKEALRASLAGMTGKRAIEVFSNRKSYKIMEKDIDCIKAYNGYTLIEADENEYRSELSLKYYEELLDERIFFKVNRSCLVNLLKVYRKSDGKAYLGAEQLNISRRQKKDFYEKFMKADTEFR